MKKTVLLLMVSLATFCGYTQNRLKQQNATTSAGTGGRPKLVNPESKTPFPYAHFVEHGLEDNAGNLWFTTSEGIYRYDGSSFTLFEEMDGVDVRSKMSSKVNIAKDSSGNIWFGNIGTAIHFNGHTFKSIKMPSNSVSEFFGIAESGTKKRNLWDDIPEALVFPDRSGTVWFFSGCDVFRYNETTGAAELTGLSYYMKNVIAPYDSIRKDYTIQLVYQNSKGDLWFCAKGCQTPKNESYRLFGDWASNPCILNHCKHNLSQPNDEAAHIKQISANFATLTIGHTGKTFAFTCCMEDRDGSMWFGSDHEGAYRYDVKEVSSGSASNGCFVTRFTTNDQLSKSAITTIFQDRTGKIWFGTAPKVNFQGNGVFCFDPSAMQKSNVPILKHFTTRDGLCNKSPFSNNVINVITEDNLGKIWFGGDGGVSNYDGKKIITFSTKEGMADDHIGFLLKDKKGKIWLGTWNLGLYCYDGKSMKCFTESKF